MDTEKFPKFALFKDVENDVISQLITSRPITKFYPGDYLITRNESNKYLFFILKGKAEVYLDTADAALNIISSGESIGEISVLDGQPASAHVIALSECHAIIINKNETWELAKNSHAFTINLLQFLTNRLRCFNDQLDESIQIQHQVEHKARIDALTGLYNRRWFDDQFDLMLQRCIDNKQGFSFIMIDIDHFKLVNDNYGHAVGDIVLEQMGKILKDHARERDAVVRYGGEELAMLLPNTNQEQVLSIAERLRHSVENAIFQYQKEKSLSITISLGCSSYTNNESTKQLMKLADDALYKAKESGRNQVCC
jgi:diguanylate cyclase (GGDEF)-like protein